MKHLFLVHSPVTYLVSVTIINELKIPKEDAIIIFDRFKLPVGENDTYVGIGIHDIYKKELSFKKIVDFFRHFSMVDRIDRLVDTIIHKEKFIDLSCLYN